jgi:hypothetical protein
VQPTPVQPVAPAKSDPVDYSGRFVGNWLVSAKFDRFGDGGSFSAFTIDGDIGFGVRCLQHNLSLAVMVAGSDPKPLEKGMSTRSSSASTASPPSKPMAWRSMTG